MKLTYFKRLKVLIIILIFNISTATIANKLDSLTLSEAIRISLLNDPWIVGNEFTQESIDAMSISIGTLPDPKISLSMANFPTDTFNFGQEAMTQFKVGISQMIPRGKSLNYKRKQLKLKSESYPYQRSNRKAQIKVTVSQLWLDIYKAQMSISLIEKDKKLFEQLSDIVELSYSSALGRTRQQDIIRAQLELIRLEDRLTTLKLTQESNLEKINQWVSSYLLSHYSKTMSVGNHYLKVSDKLPEIELTHASIYTKNKSNDEIFQLMKDHPMIVALRKKIASTEVGIDLAKQKYKPAFAVNASYGYRGTAPSGDNRADFLSLGVTFDIPLFTKNKQDQELKSAIAKTEAIKTDEWLLIRKMIASYETFRVKLLRLNQR
ncbi:MAG: TolC family protein, partial [Alcanivoracaceae bacterium]|nr:TolC family protein [Alcanivoracaceae bacterium]